MLKLLQLLAEALCNHELENCQGAGQRIGFTN